MKNLFFIAVVTGAFTGSAITVKGQARVVAMEKPAKKSSPQTSLHFIEDIEITPDKISDNLPAAVATARAVNGVKTLPDVNTGSIENCSALQFKYAMLMNREVETLTNTTLYKLIDDWWATRYHYGGTDKNGIDCSAFSAKILAGAYGIALPRTASEQYDLTEKVTTENLKEGDLVFFNTRRGVSHVGVYLGDNYFVHSSVSAGVTINSLTDDYYSRKFIGGGRVVNKQAALAGIVAHIP